jgi:hypothetical protein
MESPVNPGRFIQALDEDTLVNELETRFIDQ